MKYKVGDPVVLKETSDDVKIIGVDEANTSYIASFTGFHGRLMTIYPYEIDEKKTADLKKDKTLNHYAGELEKVVAEKNKIHSNAAIEAKYTADKIDRHKELTDYMHNTYVIKNKDYGDSFSRVHREIGWQSSLGDIAHKFYRLQNLMQNKGERQVEDETTIDTLIDLANYSLLLAMELEEEEHAK